MQSYLQLQFDEVSLHLDGVRKAALRFTAALGEAQPRHQLACFGTAAFFVQALEEGYSKLRELFLRDRTRGGVVPIIDDYDIRKAFLSALDVRSMEDVAMADVPGQVAQALTRLAELIPEAAAQDTINAQLASRAFSTLNLERQEFVQKAGKVILVSRAWIDSIDKKYSKRNTYHYSCREKVRNQAAVMSELVRQYNFDRDQSFPTWVPSWNEIDDATRDVSRSPNVLHLLGAELRFKVSTFEWHLTSDFAAFLSEFISLHLRR